MQLHFDLCRKYVDGVIYICIHICIHTCVYICIYIYIHIYIYIYIYVCFTFLFILVFIFIFIFVPSLADLAHSDEGRLDVDALKDRASNWSKLGKTEKQLRRSKKKRVTVAQIKQMAGKETLFSASIDAMRMIKATAAIAIEKGEVTRRQQSECNNAMCGLTYALTHGGRSMEWRLMTETEY